MKAARLGQRLNGKTQKNVSVEITVSERAEHFLHSIFLCLSGVLVIVQIILLTPFRSTIARDYTLEGVQLGSQAYLFTPCRMELKLTDLERCPDLFVLVNGTERAVFETNTVLLELKDGDVVELDAGSALTLPKVQVNAVSENLKPFLGRIITAKDGISLVARVKISR